MAVLKKIPVCVRVCVCVTLVIEMGGVRHYGNLLESHRLFDALPEAAAGSQHVALMTVFTALALSVTVELQLTGVLNCLYML